MSTLIFGGGGMGIVAFSGARSAGAAQEQTRVMVIHDNQFVRQAIQTVLLQAARQFAVQSMDVNTLAQGAWEPESTDVMILGVQRDGAELSFLKTLSLIPSVKVLVMADRADEALVEQSIHLGAKGVFHHCCEPGQLVNAVAAVHRGEFWIERKFISRMLMESGRRDAKPTGRRLIDDLTPAELKILSAIAKVRGSSNKRVAAHLGLSEHTVRNHLSRIYTKLGLLNRVDLFSFVQRHLPEFAA
ncbi:MAG TPA: response regulator transcription factor [Candidatus Kapabacteria bacterium]|nr:response regulator transcription factor [Candidatus Kapabacteria bacterium]